MPATTPDRLAVAKQDRRREVLERRAGRDATERRAHDLERSQRLLGLLENVVDEGAVVALHASVPPEPDTHEVIAALLDRGHPLLLPKLAPPASVNDPRWGWCTPGDGWGARAWVVGPRGIAEPAGAALPGAQLAEADVVVCAALAAGLDGSRLGTGGGWYDRALVHVREGVPVIALLNDDEVIATVPHGALDRRIDAVVTPRRVLWVGPRATG